MGGLYTIDRKTGAWLGGRQAVGILIYERIMQMKPSC
jgi:hypothetical protein